MAMEILLLLFLFMNKSQSSFTYKPSFPLIFKSRKKHNFKNTFFFIFEAKEASNNPHLPPNTRDNWLTLIKDHLPWERLACCSLYLRHTFADKWIAVLRVSQTSCYVPLSLLHSIKGIIWRDSLLLCILKCDLFQGLQHFSPLKNEWCLRKNASWVSVWGGAAGTQFLTPSEALVACKCMSNQPVAWVCDCKQQTETIWRAGGG